MVVNFDRRNQKVLAVNDPAGSNTTSALWGSGLTVGIWHETRVYAGCATMIHLTAIRTAFITITTAGKRIENKQAYNKKQHQRNAQCFFGKAGLYI